MFKNNGNIYVTEKASKGKAIKVKSYRGGGMDMGNAANQKQSAALGNSSSTTKSTNKTTTSNNSSNNSISTGKTTKTNKNQFNTNNRDVPFSKPFGYKSQIAAGLLGVGPALSIANFGAKQNYKGRQKFATKEGLARDFYRMENKPLQPNSPIGKTYLKDAGFGKNKNPINTGGNGNKDDNYKIPIIPIETTKSVDMNLVKPKENFFNFKAYKVGGLSGGVRYGPPPKRGPNPNVPPIKMKHGSKKEIKAGYHKMPDGSIMKNSDHKGSK
mgnify:CR=1 FL=1